MAREWVQGSQESDQGAGRVRYTPMHRKRRGHGPVRTWMTSDIAWSTVAMLTTAAASNSCGTAIEQVSKVHAILSSSRSSPTQGSC